MNSNGAVDTDAAIQHPNIFYFVIDGSWSLVDDLEYWNKGNITTTANSNTVYKTIYSPSPTGYIEPKSIAFTGFTTTGENTVNSGQYNVSGAFNKGWNFYSLPNFQGSTIFFSTLGLRDVTSSRVSTVTAGMPTSIYIDGSYWTANPSSLHSKARVFSGQGNNNGVYPLGENYRGYGMSLRSVLE